MKRVKVFGIAVLIALLIGSCGGKNGSGTSSSSGPGKISMHYKKNFSDEKVDKEFDVKKGFAITSWITVPGTESERVVRYYITVTDFDYDPQKGSGKPKADGQTSVEIDFFADKGAPEDTPIKAGTYQLANRSEKPWNSYGKINNVVAYTFQNGKEDAYSFVANAKGTVKISTVTSDSVTGEVDLTQDNGGSIKGNFIAKIFKMKS